ncbi:MAG: stage 0 sporulation family protein [Clostridia bacterium]|nr:stage 0 sporulation family protein [Clostridia bacterium]
MNEPLSLPVDDQDLLASPEVLVPSTIPPEDRVDVVGVRFRAASKAYYFDPKGKTLHMGDFVVADTARGPEFGEVAFGNRAMNKKAITTPLRPILRVATPEDVARNKENRDREKEAGEVFYQKVREHRLAMKLIDVQFAFDNSKLLFYFTSEGRVDFRELVKDLAGVFRTRIELRQIGIRDEARLLGGLGACGRTLCCATFLPDFAQVSIKMAKEQGLSLNSAKISGACGRLMCCLRYEAESYAEEIRRTPPVGSTVKTPDGVGDVIGNNPIAATVRVKLKDQDAPKQYSRDEVTVIGFAKRESAEKQNPS